MGSLPQPLPKGKGFGAALTGIFFWESKRQRDEETKRRRVKETERRREFEQGLVNGWSMVGVVFPGRRGKKTGCLVRRSDRVGFALV